MKYYILLILILLNCRFIDGQIQEFSSLCSYMQQFTKEQFLEAVSDFHLLIFIATMDMFPMKVIFLLNIYLFKNCLL